MNSEAIITMEHLHVSYGKTKVVNGLSFAINAGECFGLQGPNGAGKTTTLSCLEGLKQPERGLFASTLSSNHILLVWLSEMHFSPVAINM